jgi:hypothetical protein
MFCKVELYGFVNLVDLLQDAVEVDFTQGSHANTHRSIRTVLHLSLLSRSDGAAAIGESS